MSRPGVLSAADLERIRSEFGVATEQVRRDHAISHVLAALGRMDRAGSLVFIGGTALARTLLPALRLSEDIDLVTSAPRGEMAQEIERAIAVGLQRTHGAASWSPPLSVAADAESAVLSLDQGIRIRVQLLTAVGYPPWPTERADLEQRYADAPPASLTTPTAAAFAAGKAIAWGDRRASRDLYDLWGLSVAGHIDTEAVELLCRYGPTISPDLDRLFSTPPTAQEWSAALDHQGVVRVGPVEALEVVRESWTKAARDGGGLGDAASDPTP